MVDEKLATWLHAVELAPGSERQAAIAAAANTFAGQAKSADLPNLVLLAHGIAAQDAFSIVATTMGPADTTFGCSIDDLETHLIAATFVAALLERNSLVATTAASLVLNAHATGLQSPINELPVLAVEARQRRGSGTRQRGAITSGLDLAASFDPVPAFDEGGAGATHEQVLLLRTATTESFDAVVKSVQALTRSLSTRLRAADEELDLLWWCFGGRSDLLNAEWTKVTNPGLASIAAAKEMHSLLQFPAEPASAAALLTKCLGKHADKQTTLASAVTAATKSGVVVEIADGHRLLPVLSALRESNAMDGKVAWKESAQRWSVDPDRNWTALDLASACLRELIILDNIA